jgi:hypothetical protein
MQFNQLKRREFITLLGGSNIMFEVRTCDWLRISVLGGALLAVAQTAAAQSFPSRPLTLVVPFAAGGPSDVAARIVAQGLSEKLRPK